MVVPSSSVTMDRLKDTQPVFTCSNFKKRNTRTRCEICSKLTIKIPEQRRVNFKQANTGWVETLNMLENDFYC